MWHFCLGCLKNEKMASYRTNCMVWFDYFNDYLGLGVCTISNGARIIVD